MSYPYKKLFKTALIASPLMVLMAILPRYFQTIPLFDEVVLKFFSEMLQMALLWAMNISLVKLFENNPKQYLRYLTSIIITGIAIYLFSTFWEHPKPFHPPNYDGVKPYFSQEGKEIMRFPRKMPFPFLASIFNNFFVLFIIDIVIARNRERIAINENNELKIKNLEAQQLQLRQQIQPHFLFNSLNTLKSLISNYPNEAEEYLVKLSSFLRYNINSTNQDLILLKDELAICNDYLQIQKVRFKDALKYSIAITDKNALTSNIPTFALQLLIENAIKHNVFTIEKPLNIQIILTKNNEISVLNNLQVKQFNEHSTKIGLENLSKRYSLLIKKDIRIIKTLDKFEVILPLA